MCGTLMHIVPIVSRLEEQMVRKRRTVSYEQSRSDDLDLEQLLQQLRDSRRSPYRNRSLSDIGGMILLDAAAEEVAHYCESPETETNDGEKS